MVVTFIFKTYSYFYLVTFFLDTIYCSWLSVIWSWLQIYDTGKTVFIVIIKIACTIQVKYPLNGMESIVGIEEVKKNIIIKIVKKNNFVVSF